jgi:hypothetical protein
MSFAVIRRRLLMSVEVTDKSLVIKAANRTHRRYRLLRTSVEKCTVRVLAVKDLPRHYYNITSKSDVYALEVPMMPRLLRGARCLIVCGLTEAAFDMWSRRFPTNSLAK